MDFSLQLPTQAQESDPWTEVMALRGALQTDSGRIMCSPSDFEEVCELGRGSFGIVHAVRHRESGFTAAKKVLRMSGGTKQTKEVREILLLHRSSSPYIVRYLGLDVRDGDLLLYTELMETSWDKVLRRVCERNELIPNHIVAHIAYSLTHGLSYLKQNHEAMHLDVKPSNVLLGSDGSIKLADFGLSNFLQESRLSFTGGCLLYMAPEMLHNKVVDVRADVWSLGITLYELCARTHPFGQARTDFDLLHLISTSSAPVLPEAVRHHYAPDLVSFITYCLQVNSNDRPKYVRPPANNKALPPLLETPLILHHTAPTDIMLWFRTL